MRLRDFDSYLFIPSKVDEPKRYIHEIKRREWMFITIRWLWVFFLLIAVWLNHPEEESWMMIIGGLLAFCNALSCMFNTRIKTPRSQHILGISMLILDTLFAWVVIMLFTRDLYTAAYASYIYVILEAAIRFGLIGSLSMIVVFILGLIGVYEYHLAVHDLHFDVSAYIFWTILMSVVAISVGIIIHEGRRQRWKSERYLKESTLLLERNRIARELHDTVLKTLQGLSLEARALENRTAMTTPSVKETAQYIEEVCSRTSREIREVILDLRNDDEITGITSQIAKMVNEWSTATGITAEFTQSGQDVVFPAEPNRHLRNVVSEVMNNIQRHASASRIQIAINISADTLDIEIMDNGHGIKRSVDDLHLFVAEGKLGIAGIIERIELLGGHFSLSSNQSGTVIHLSVPINRLGRNRNEHSTDSHS